MEKSASELSEGFVEFSISRYGVKLHINEPGYTPEGPVSLDVETDEKDSFVGIALCDKPDEVWYYSDLPLALESMVKASQVIGHNIKSDLHWLKRWGIQFEMSQVLMDTMIMSYVINPTKESHGLKKLGEELLNLKWPSYRDMVGKGRKRLTLDKQPIEAVANYCGMDAIATLRIYHLMRRRITPTQLGILNNLEMPIMRLLYLMETEGLTVDVDYLKNLNVQFGSQIKELEDALTSMAEDKEFNPRSPKQVVAFLRKQGIETATTQKKDLLLHKDVPFVDALFKHRELSKLHSTYVKRMLSSSTLPKVHPDFSQVSVDENADEWKGIRTGRLSSDYHNIPRRSEKGKLLRKAFVAPEGKVIICGDYSQIEYRLLAHFSKEPMLLEAYRNGKDVHEETARLFGSTNRDIGKTLNFAAIYGAQAKKIAFTSGLKVDEAQRLLDTYWKSLRRVSSWIQRIKFEARQRKGVRTILGRFIPLEGMSATNPFERFHAERQAVNYVIQGSAADVIKLAMLRCNEAGYFPILQVHDELLFIEDMHQEMHGVTEQIKFIMESVVKLDVPLEVDIGYGKNWDEAKESHK